MKNKLALCFVFLCFSDSFSMKLDVDYLGHQSLFENLDGILEAKQEMIKKVLIFMRF